MTIFKNSFSSTASVDLCLNNAIALAQVDGPSMCVAQGKERESVCVCVCVCVYGGEGEGENTFSGQAISDVIKCLCI